jgi:hypothetical protein
LLLLKMDCKGPFKGGAGGSDTDARFLSAINSASALGLENGGDCREGSTGGMEKSNSLLENDEEEGGMLPACTPPVRPDFRLAAYCWRDAGRAGNWLCASI